MSEPVAWWQKPFQPEVGVAIHALGTVIALALTPPAIIWWRDSVPYLVGISQAAWMLGHWSGLQGALAELRVKRQDDKT